MNVTVDNIKQELQTLNSSINNFNNNVDIFRIMFIFGAQKNKVMNAILLGIIGGQEILLILLVVLLLFGGKKIPELMRGIGKGIKSFKDGVQGMEEDLRDDKKSGSGKDKKEPPKEPAG